MEKEESRAKVLEKRTENKDNEGEEPKIKHLREEAKRLRSTGRTDCRTKSWKRKGPRPNHSWGQRRRNSWLLPLKISSEPSKMHNNAHIPD